MSEPKSKGLTVTHQPSTQMKNLKVFRPAGEHSAQGRTAQLPERERAGPAVFPSVLKPAHKKAYE